MAFKHIVVALALLAVTAYTAGELRCISSVLYHHDTCWQPCIQQLQLP